MTKKIVVPEGMLKAAVEDAAWNGPIYGARGAIGVIVLEAGLRWLSENPIVPNASDTLGLLQEIVQSGHLSNEEYCSIPSTTVRAVIREWQCRMFLAPEPEVPEAIKDLLLDERTNEGLGKVAGKSYNNALIEAYQRGLNGTLAQKWEYERGRINGLK